MSSPATQQRKISPVQEVNNGLVKVFPTLNFAILSIALLQQNSSPLLSERIRSKPSFRPQDTRGPFISSSTTLRRNGAERGRVERKGSRKIINGFRKPFCFTVIEELF